MLLTPTEPSQVTLFAAVRAVGNSSLRATAGGTGLKSASKRFSQVELGRRIGLAVSATVYGNTATVYAGPTATSAIATKAGGVLVKFGLQVGVSAIAFNSTARCPAPTLKVFCTGAGFEVQVDGVWTPAAASLVGSSTVLVTAPSKLTAAVAAADRVRYAHADWPVVSVRNAADAGEIGLPAQLFDLAVTAE